MPEDLDRIPRLEDELARRLKDAGVRTAYAARLVGEIAEHAHEIRRGAGPEIDDAEVERRVRARLGSPETIRDAACADRRRLQWARRSPLLVFAIGPALAIPLGFAAICLSIVGAIEIVEAAWPGPIAEQIEFRLAPQLDRLVEATRIAVPVLVALAIGLLGRRARADARWATAASFALFVSTTSTRLLIDVPTRLGAEGSIGLAVGEPTWNAYGLFGVALLWPVFTDREGTAMTPDADA